MVAVESHAIRLQGLPAFIASSLLLADASDVTYMVHQAGTISHLNEQVEPKTRTGLKGYTNDKTRHGTPKHLCVVCRHGVFGLAMEYMHELKGKGPGPWLAKQPLESVTLRVRHCESKHG